MSLEPKRGRKDPQVLWNNLFLIDVTSEVDQGQNLYNYKYDLGLDSLHIYDEWFDNYEWKPAPLFQPKERHSNKSFLQSFGNQSFQK